MRLFILCFILFSFNNLFAGTWCKATYHFNENFKESEFLKQLERCKNNDNLFISINKQYINANHLLNATIANYCDLNRNILKSSPTDANDSFHSAVCVFRKHFLRLD